MRERKKDFYQEAEVFSDGMDKHPIKSDEEILEKMNDAKKKKRRWALFRGAYISKSSYKALRRKGYKVIVYEDKWQVPCFEISWYKRK